MSEHDESGRFGRRAFVTRAGLVAGGVLGASLLEACGSGSPSAGSKPAGGATSTPTKLPSYAPFQGPKPDLPGNEQGLDPAFFKFPDPSSLVPTVTTPPGDGSTVTAI